MMQDKRNSYVFVLITCLLALSPLLLIDGCATPRECLPPPCADGMQLTKDLCVSDPKTVDEVCAGLTPAEKGNPTDASNPTDSRPPTDLPPNDQNTPTDTPTSPDLILHWNFETQDVLDQSGEGRKGTPNGASIINAGKIGKAVEFKAGANNVSFTETGGRVILPANKPYTISLWFKNIDCPSLSPNGCGIVALGDEQTPLINLTIEKQPPIPLGGEWKLGLMHGKSATPVFVTPQDLVSQPEWKHLAITYQNAKASFYINGSPEVENTAIPTTQKVTMLWLGSSPSIRAAVGQFDEFKLFDRVLTKTEIEALAKED